MNYIIVFEGKVFFTKWFEKENHFAKGMVIINIKERTYSNDGEVFHEIEDDHL